MLVPLPKGDFAYQYKHSLCKRMASRAECKRAVQSISSSEILPTQRYHLIIVCQIFKLGNEYTLTL